MKGNIIHLFFMVVIFYHQEVKCAKVVKSGIEEIPLNANRESRLWTAAGNNGTQGTELMTHIICE